jgi:hypothetical protein
MHTFTARALKIIAFADGLPLPADSDSFVLQGDFLLNGNLRVPGEGKIHLERGFSSAFVTPPPMIEIGFAGNLPDTLFPLMLAGVGSRYV